MPDDTIRFNLSSIYRTRINIKQSRNLYHDLFLSPNTCTETNPSQLPSNRIPHQFRGLLGLRYRVLTSTQDRVTRARAVSMAVPTGTRSSVTDMCVIDRGKTTGGHTQTSSYFPATRTRYAESGSTRVQQRGLGL